MAIVEISVVPIGTGATSLSPCVSRVVAEVTKSPLNYELTAMGTIIHGELDEIWPVLRRMHESLFTAGEVTRVLTLVKIDDRRDKMSTPGDKVRSVIDKLPRE
jgi:uncharacterized protein (TIGR00106 family)